MTSGLSTPLMKLPTFLASLDPAHFELYGVETSMGFGLAAELLSREQLSMISWPGESFTVVVERSPDQCLNPNLRGTSWTKSAKSRQDLRKATRLAVISAQNRAWSARGPKMGGAALFETTVSADIVIAWGRHPNGRNRHRIDQDNALASLKPVFDGLQDALVVQNDKQITHHHVYQRHTTYDEDPIGWILVRIRPT